MDRAEELRNQIAKYEALSEQKKTKRLVKTLVCLSIAFYVLWLWLGAMEGIVGYLLGLLASPVCAGIYFYINTLIFLPITSGAMNENIAIERLKTELRLLEKGQE